MDVLTETENVLQEGPTPSPPAPRAAYDRLGVRPLEHHQVNVGGLPAERVAFTMTLRGIDAQTVSYRFVQYIVLNTQKDTSTLFLLQFILDGHATDTGDVAVEQIADSFQIVLVN